MASKPFIAARIPENLNLKLEEHSKTTGEGKTQALINALSAYLSFAPETESRENAGDRLSLLEAKVAELERILKEPQQISLLDTSTVTTKKPDNASDNKIDNISQTDISKKNKFDNQEMATLSSSTYDSVRGKHRRKTPIKVGEKTYLPIEEGSPYKWQIIEG